MSILNVEHVTHGFGARQILNDASFRLLRGEHVGLVGANGEGKSTFLSIITGKLMPDEGKVEWCRHITTGYLDQFSTLEKGKTIRDVLQDAFRWKVPSVHFPARFALPFHTRVHAVFPPEPQRLPWLQS